MLGIVMAHGFSGVKEQRLGRYAEVSCAAAFAVLVYDHRNFGTSGGEVVVLDDRVRAVVSNVAFTGHPGVDCADDAGRFDAISMALADESGYGPADLAKPRHIAGCVLGWPVVGSRPAFERAREPKRLHSADCTHFEVYDGDYSQSASTAMRDFLLDHL